MKLTCIKAPNESCDLIPDADVLTSETGSQGVGMTVGITDFHSMQWHLRYITLLGNSKQKWFSKLAKYEATSLNRAEGFLIANFAYFGSLIFSVLDFKPPLLAPVVVS